MSINLPLIRVLFVSEDFFGSCVTKKRELLQRLERPPTKGFHACRDSPAPIHTGITTMSPSPLIPNRKVIREAKAIMDHVIPINILRSKDPLLMGIYLQCTYIHNHPKQSMDTGT